MEAHDYIGQELELFSKARRWKAYWATQVRPYLGTSVLEVGAGLGANTRFLWGNEQTSWVCLEPDRAMAHGLESAVRSGTLPAACRVVPGTVKDLPERDRFDGILYADVLEHIEDDARELSDAALHLSPGGHLIVLSPAYAFLTSPFDSTIGHYRRYHRASLLAAAPETVVPVRMTYLDSAGLLTSLVNRAFLRQSMPTSQQIAFWDRYLIPVSRTLDSLTLGSFGRSILGVFVRR